MDDCSRGLSGKGLARYPIAAEERLLGILAVCAGRRSAVLTGQINTWNRA
jgi:hypothetical protein